MSPRSLGRVGVFSVGIARIRDLRALIGADAVVLNPVGFRSVDTVVGWGQKPNTARARRYAQKHGVPFVALEDGFLRSVGLGVHGDPPLSLVLDDAGIYYDATRPSELERTIGALQFEPGELERARSAIAAMRATRLGKYNDAPVVPLPGRDRPRVLVVDQTAGDQSLRLGLCHSGGFAAMLEAALDENADAEVLVRTHPDVARGPKSGHFEALGAHPRVRWLTDARNAGALLEQVDRVYAMTSHMGFEALLAGRLVTCFGVPWYAGWGLTDDRGAVPDRRHVERTVEQLFAAAYLRYARYVDPESGEPSTLERVIEHLALQRQYAEAPRRVVAVGFSAWKRSFLPSFLSAPGTEVAFADDAKSAAAQLTPGAALATWGGRAQPELEALAEESGATLHRIEDGFLRSVGLGSDLYSPASLVVDARGLHYDPTRPSDLEVLLAEGEFSGGELERARALRERITSLGVSKYNVGVSRAVGRSAGRRSVVLVVGQVEGDASIELGCVDVRDNGSLLREARRLRPDAHLVYRPHPDVMSGNRASGLSLERARTLCDEVAEDATLADCLRAADEVHVMTSLVGFEALLRGLRVVCHGRPFYAGWGLTEDRHELPRRTRELSLDELTAGVLLRYPRYVHPRTSRYTSAEAIVEHLAASRRQEDIGWARRQLTKGWNLSRELLRSRTKRRTLERGVGRPAWLGARAPQVADEVSCPLPELGVSHALLLQGPAGPFMRRFAEDLRDADVAVTKVNFHAGDVLFYPGADTVSFRETFADWPHWVGELMDARGVDGLFVFGDCRELHAAAIEVARSKGVPVWCFEEGYLRPDWITLEAHGVNGNSRMPRDAAFYRGLELEPMSPPQPIGQRMPFMSWYSTLNALVFTHLNQGFPHYRHHRNLNAWFQMFVWLRNVARKQRFERAEHYLHDVVKGPLSGRYFFIPLQVHCDFQLRHSPYEDMLDFVREVVAAFAAHAPEDCSLIVKHHPMDRPYKEYGALFAQLAREHQLGERLIYCHDVHLPTLLRNARGTITINSTVGLSSIHHGTPTKVMGTAVYDIEGMTFRGDLEQMFQLEPPPAPDAELYRAFRRYLLHTSQHNGTFYKRLPGLSRGTGIRWHRARSPLHPSPPHARPGV